MVFCMAFGCSNASFRKGRKTKAQQQGKEVSFHRLPLNDKEQLRKWVAALKLKQPHINCHSRVCSDHFEKDMFEDDSMKVRLTGGKSAKRLKRNAVPTKFVYSMERSQATIKQRDDRHRLLAEKRWPKKAISLEAVLESDEGEPSEVTVPIETETALQEEVIPLEACCCQRVVKVSVSTQTNILADPVKLQHDHPYAKSTMVASRKPMRKIKVVKESISKCTKKKTTKAVPEYQVFDKSDEDTDIDSDNNTDLPYVPSNSGSDSSEDEDNTSQNGHTDDSVFLVYKSSLDSLFQTCIECGSILAVTQVHRGTMLVYEWICHNNHRGRWESQPIIRGMPQGNLDLSAAILFAGGTYQKVFDIATTMHLQIFTERHFMNIQRSYLFPVIDRLYQEEHQIWIDAFRYQHVFLGGDGRSDSPGHCAKYLSYSFMEEESDLILHFELVQSTEAPSQAATNMERVGFNRGMSYLLEEDILVDGITTDMHPQIGCDMNKIYPELQHEFDIFHVAKNINKKLRKKANKKGFEDLQYWLPSINNHFWWCCASSNGEYMNLKDKWMSLLHHVCNIHEWNSADTYHKCDHATLQRDEVRDISWLKPDSPAHKALQDIVLNKKLLKDMKKMSLFKHTGALEVFHGMLLKYCPKREHFSYEGMRARLQLAVMDHNENVGREQATTDDGTLRFGLAFPKRKKQWIVKKVYEEKTFNFRKQLMEMVCTRRNDDEVVLGVRYVSRPDLPSNIASSERPDKQEAIAAFRTRFKLDVTSDDTL